MKTSLNTRHFLNYQYKQLLQLCQEKLKSFLLRLALSWRDYSQRSISLRERLLKGVSLVDQIGRVALNELLSNKRHLVGVVSIGLLLFAIFFHQIFFNEADRELLYKWHYVNNYYFYWTIRPCVVLFFLSVSFILFSPVKWKLAYVPASVANSLAWLGIIYYSFFVQTNYDHHHISNWSVFWSLLVFSLSIGFGFIMSIDYLCYRKYHLKDGTTARVAGIVKAPNVPIEVKYKHLETLVAEAENFNARV